MNDICTVTKNFNPTLYADDTTLTSPLFVLHKNKHETSIRSHILNSELNDISDWLAVNKLSLNVKKTKFMIFHFYQKS